MRQEGAGPRTIRKIREASGSANRSRTLTRFFVLSDRAPSARESMRPCGPRVTATPATLDPEPPPATEGDEPDGAASELPPEFPPPLVVGAGAGDVTRAPGLGLGVDWPVDAGAPTGTATAVVPGSETGGVGGGVAGGAIRTGGGDGVGTGAVVGTVGGGATVTVGVVGGGAGSGTETVGVVTVTVGTVGTWSA